MYCIGKMFAVSVDLLPFSMDDYGDSDIERIIPFLMQRMMNNPLNFFSFLFLALAIVHIFVAPVFARIADSLKHSYGKNLSPMQHFKISLLHYLGEIEIVFILWAIPLMLVIWFLHGWEMAMNYFSSRDYSDPVFVFVIMTIASTKPILNNTKKFLKGFAQFFGNSPGAWWMIILTVTPLLGSIITEAGAMTIASLLLAEQFYKLKPSKILSYATLGLLFVNVSIGGVLTHFAAPPVLMVAKQWEWDTPFMVANFGWKVIVAILISNISYFCFFKDEFKKLGSKIQNDSDSSNVDTSEHCPLWITFVHVAFLVWMVLTEHYPALTLGGFFLFFGFHQATLSYQSNINIKSSIMVGMFLAGIIIHAGLQNWWISPLYTQFTNSSTLMTLLTILTSFNDNAALTYLSSQVSNLTAEFKYAIVAGAIAGGGLTVIANAPNPAGQLLLKQFFYRERVSPLNLLLGALFPTIVVWMILNFL